MTFENSEEISVSRPCDVRSECKKESDSRYFKALFEREWDHIVIRKNEISGAFDMALECCGRLISGGDRSERFADV